MVITVSGNSDDDNGIDYLQKHDEITGKAG